MSSSPTLESLLFEVLFRIAAYLDIRDYIHLSHWSRSMFRSMKDIIIARATVKNILLCSKEGQAAWASKTGYYQAIRHRFDVHEAVATASPYSVSVLAYAADFLYHQGFLCYRVKNQIRLLDVHNTGQKELVLDLDHMNSYDTGIEYILSDVGEQPTLLRFSCGILILLFSQANSNDADLVAIRIQPRPDQARQSLSSSDPIFVRHTRLYIWFGTFTAVNGRQSAWVLRGMQFKTLQRTEFSVEFLVDGELGKRVCFEIYQGHLYVVSIIDQQESSFYHWSCYSPDHENNLGNGRLWRYEHREGPINEMGADLSIQAEEEKGRLVHQSCSGCL
ncbi:hypothetical protein N7471_010727 [Penicillium samsonianum]|uniref:uncharacterized protein n=1 Tax=Penicillium samsonianum TaxID=1882272 RepID=UPI0025498892|nr:uncharacterized protein N7471_010727 [Penicillium samsonianum]KAJ6126234.1 hypothetical protein N7471_010727 [Penicillium samsonianum]